LSNAKQSEATEKSASGNVLKVNRDVGGLQSSSDMPTLKQVSNPAKRHELLIKKLELCSEVVDFASMEPEDLQLKEVKRHTLLELVDFVNSSAMSGGNSKGLTEEILKPMIDMVRANIFVALSPQMDDFDPEEDDPWLDPSWPHKQVVFEFLLRLVVSSELNAKMAKRQGMIDQQFCINLINLFESEDPRERDYLKTILHRIYGKFMSHRSFIRRQIGYTFAQFVNESHKHNGIGELLEILGSIINGFALPLKAEHVSFIERSLIPLHKTRWYQNYQQQLTYCITQYIEKDAITGVLVVTKLIEYWPWASSQKQVLFLNELEEILEILPDAIIDQVAQVLFRGIARCVSSNHFQVSERALFLWNNEQLVNAGCLSKNYADRVLPVVYPALLKNIDPSTPHWNPTVNSLSHNVIDLYKDYLSEKQFAMYTKGCTADADIILERRMLDEWNKLADATK